MKKPKLWGEFQVSNPPVPQLPPVGHIRGARVEYGEDEKPKAIRVQYKDENDHHHELVMGFLDAMFLLSCLKSIQLDEGHPFPDDPRAPSAKVDRSR